MGAISVRNKHTVFIERKIKGTSRGTRWTKYLTKQSTNHKNVGIAVVSEKLMVAHFV
jgi:hypothetical protein